MTTPMVSPYAGMDTRERVDALDCESENASEVIVSESVRSPAATGAAQRLELRVTELIAEGVEHKRDAMTIAQSVLTEVQRVSRRASS